MQSNKEILKLKNTHGEETTNKDKLLQKVKEFHRELCRNRLQLKENPMEIIKKRE